MSERWRDTYDAWKTACPYDDWEEEPEEDEPEEDYLPDDEWEGWEIES
jgi:hypothetical protein